MVKFIVKVNFNNIEAEAEKIGGEMVDQIEVEEEMNVPYFSDISPHLYTSITELVCPHSGLTELPPNLPNLRKLNCMNNRIRFIPNYPNLQELFASYNSLVSIGQCPKLKILYCRNNNLTEIGDYPILEQLHCELNKIKNIHCQSPYLWSLMCHVNKLKSIPFFPNLTSLYCHYNNLTSIPQFPNLSLLYCGNNQITEIPEMVNVMFLQCQNNRLTTLPNLPNWRQLETIDYSNNEITYIPPDITRFLNLLNRRNLNRQNEIGLAVYGDSQNTHNHQIQESIRESIKSIIKDPPQLHIDDLLSEITASTDLDKDSKDLLVKFSQDTEVHSSLNITFKELLLSVWSIIHTHKYKADILQLLCTEMKDSVNKCFTGRMSRLVNCLNGYDPRVKVEMPLNDQIANVILMIDKHLTEKNKYSVELHKQLVTEELRSRGFEQSEIDLWIQYIE